MTKYNAISGIYIIVHVKSGKVYIGKAENIRKRWHDHKHTLNNGNHHNRYLQRAWNKYGEQAFKFQILEYCSIEHFEAREKHYIAIYKVRGLAYNMTDGGEGVLGIVHSSETKKKMSIAANARWESLDYRAIMVAKHKGKTIPLEQRAKMSLAHKGHKPTAEAHEKSIITNRKNYIFTSPDGIEYKVNGLTKFCRENGLSGGAMCNVAKGKRPHHKGWKCRYDNQT